MEEILASIRRIISEEEEAPAAKGEVLDLTQPAEPAPALVDAADDLVFDDVVDVTPEPDPIPEPAPAPAPAPIAAAPAPAPRAPEVPSETIISAPTASAAAGSLARLSSTLRIADTPGQTVEGVVRELLKPMLREWLDQNLPAIVEARVEAELERIARMAR